MVAVVFSVVMAFHGGCFRRKNGKDAGFVEIPKPTSETSVEDFDSHAGMVVFLVFANWAAPRVPGGTGTVYIMKWIIAALAFVFTLSTSSLVDSDERSHGWD